MANIKRINTSEIVGRSPFNEDDEAIMPSGTLVIYEDGDQHVLRMHDGVTNGGNPVSESSTGDITFEDVKIIGAEGGERAGLISLVPVKLSSDDWNFENYGQFINIYPTNAYDVPHIHIAAGSGADGTGDLMLGDDNTYVEINHNGYVGIESYNIETSDYHYWQFGVDGNLQLPAGGDIVDNNGNSVLGGGTPTRVSITDDNLVLELNDPQDSNIVIRSIVLDNNSFEVASTELGRSSGFVIRTNVNDDAQQWQFNNDGTTTFPNNAIGSPSSLSIQTPSGGIPASLTNYSGGGGWNEAYTNLATTGGTGTGLTVDVATDGSGYIDINAITINTPGTGYTNGDVITIENQSNLTATFNVVVTANTWSFGTDGSLEFPDATTQTTAWTGSVDWDDVTNAPTIPADVSDLTDTEGLLTGVSANIGAITFDDNAIQANPLDTVGTKITVNANYLGQTSQNSNVFALSKTADTNQVQIGWIIRGSGQAITNKVDSGGYWSFFVSGGTQTSYPITIESADYRAGAEPQLTLSVAPDDVAATSWTFDADGSITFPDDTVQTTAYVAANNVEKVTGTWTVTPGDTTYSFTVPANGVYQLWVRANVPNGIMSYIATAHVTNSNVPVLGTQYAWNYTGAGEPVVFTSLPTQFIGTEGQISTSNPSVGTSTNTFVFGIDNNTAENITVLYGYTKIS